MLIKTEDFPTKRIINFYVSEDLTKKGSALLFFKDADINNALLKEITDMPGVERCLVAESLFSVQYAEKSDKESIKALVLACLDDYMSDDKHFIEEENKSDLLLKCEALADALIRPTLNRDGGDIDIISLYADILQVRFTGHCAGCPYAQNTLQNVIIRTLKHYLPQIKEIKLKE